MFVEVVDNECDVIGCETIVEKMPNTSVVVQQLFLELDRACLSNVQF